MTLSVFVTWPHAPEDMAGTAVLRALERELPAFPAGAADPVLVSVLITGTEPPPARFVEALLVHLAQWLVLDPNLEVTLEAGASMATERLGDYRAAGVTRISLCARVPDDAAETMLRAAVFPRTAIDLVFLRPGQSLAAWRAEVDRAVLLAAGHISLEEHSALRAANSDLAAAFYEQALEQLTAAGMPPYEIAHFARPGEESRHLLHGARGGDYLGIGPDSVGRVTLGRTCHALTQLGPSPVWLAALDAGEQITESEVLTPEERLAELLGTGLRLRAGVERAWCEPLIGEPIEAAVAPERRDPLIRDGFLVLDQRGLRLSAKGWLLCESVLARLLS